MHISKPLIVVVEDDEPKLRAICQFINDEYPECAVEVAQSVTSAIDLIVENDVSLAIVDMSLPTYDFATDRAGGGRPQGFGGEDILHFIEAESPGTKCAVLTQYEEFPDECFGGQKSLSDLALDLKNSLGDWLLGVFYYSGQYGEWRSALKSILDNQIKGK